MNTVDDTDLENMEQFELYFETISPTGFATPVSPEVVCVNIEDDDGKMIWCLDKFRDVNH